MIWMTRPSNEGMKCFPEIWLEHVTNNSLSKGWHITRQQIESDLPCIVSRQLLQIQLTNLKSPDLVFLVSTSSYRDWVIFAPAALITSAAHFSNSLSGTDPDTPSRSFRSKKPWCLIGLKHWDLYIYSLVSCRDMCVVSFFWSVDTGICLRIVLLLSWHLPFWTWAQYISSRVVYRCWAHKLNLTWLSRSSNPDWTPCIMSFWQINASPDYWKTCIVLVGYLSSAQQTFDVSFLCAMDTWVLILILFLAEPGGELFLTVLQAWRYYLNLLFPSH